MRIQQSIENKLQSQLKPEFLQVENESHQHNVPSGSESHFKVTIVSAAFEGVNSVKRHQQVYPRVAGRITRWGSCPLAPMPHANPVVRVSEQIHLTPNCRGGSGH